MAFRDVPVNERLRLVGDMGPDATVADLAQSGPWRWGRLTEDGSAVLEEVA